MNTWKVILATLVIFGAGIITGGLLVNGTVGARHLRRPLLAEGAKKAQSPGALSPNALREIRVPLPPNILLRKDFLERIERELKLNAEQHARIEKIISEGQERIKNHCKKIEPEVKLELDETREKINAELTPAQQGLFTELLKHRPANPPRTATNSP